MPILQIIGTQFINNTALGTDLNGLGGGVEVDMGQVIVANARFEGNVSHGRYGGGLSALSAVATNTDFVSNTVDGTGGWGGGAAIGDAAIYGGRFERNTSSDNGGGLSVNYLYMTGTQIISNTSNVIYNDSANGGGGLFIIWNGTLLHSRIEDNRCATPTCSGGGLNASGGGDWSLTVSDVQFIDNTSAGGGGGVYSDHTTDLTNVKLISNSATTYGGGVYVGGIGNSRIANALFTGNHSTQDGAAAYLASTGNTDLVHATIADVNHNPQAAVSIITGIVHLTDTLIASHTIGISNTGGLVTEDYNLFFGNITDTVGVTSGGHSLIGNPRFVDPLHDDYHLRSGSPAIDHGIDAGIYTDLDGHPRPVGAGFDIGTYEMPLPVYLPLVHK
jgi:predicted outer membrane repeat protein